MSHSHEPTTFLSKYVFSFDHKVIGIQYLITALFMAVIGGLLALTIRYQLAWPSENVVSAESYLSLVTMHGTIMVFFVISMGLVSGFGNLLIPLHVGARDMAYPFLNMLSYWVMVPACLLMIGSFFVEGGAAAAGWTAYPPLSALKDAVPGSGMGQTLWLLAMALFIVSFTMGSLNYLTTILNERTRGMSMMKLPLLTWTFLISAIIGILAFPALTAAAVMLLFDRHAGTSFFLPAGMYFEGTGVLPNMGGTPLLFQHLFWFLGHPEVYVLVLPALGITFEIIAAFGRRSPFGYRTTVYSLLCVAFLSMIVWGHHMFTSGMDPRIGEYFSIVTVMITVPFSVIGLNLIGSLWQARIRAETPMLFALGVISAMGMGGLGGLYLGTATSDMYFHDSYFVVGHFHLTIGTVTFLALFGGIYHWFPKFIGRKTNEFLGKTHFWLTIIPMFAMFLLMHLQGMGGIHRRYYDVTQYSYPNASAMALMPWISYLAFALFAGQLVFAFNVIWSIFRGEKASENPWGATTLEWTTPSPAPHGNWPDEVPVVHRDPYDYDSDGDWAQNIENAEGKA